MTSDTDASRTPAMDALDGQASILMKQGIELLAGGAPGAIGDALGCFDRALELRRTLPIDAVPVFGYGLAACWLNRAEALMLRGDSGDTGAAILAFDEAISLLRLLPPDADSRFPRRLAIAYQNRGLALLREADAPSDASVAAFRDAIATLEDAPAARIPDRQYLLATVWLNLANAMASDPTDRWGAGTRDATLRAMTLIADTEQHDVDAAEVGLKARHVLCRTIARRLSAPADDGAALAADVHEATDAVDAGLVVARRWERTGESRFRGLAYDLFRFGAAVYRNYQPHFLQEFVQENMDPANSSAAYVDSAEMRGAAHEALGSTDDQAG